MLNDTHGIFVREDSPETVQTEIFIEHSLYMKHYDKYFEHILIM